MTSLCPRLDSPSLPSLPSPSSLPFRPFSQLPTEVIQHIVYSTAPSHFHPDTYIERQITLCSLCLTSRLFFQLAYPHLYAVVRLRTSEQLNSFRDTEQARASKIETRELVIDNKRSEQGNHPYFTEYWPVLATTFSLRKVTLRNVCTDVQFEQLSRLKSEFL